MINDGEFEKMVCETVQSSMGGSVPPGGVQPWMSLSSDLGLDSVGLMSLCFTLDQRLPGDLFQLADELFDAEKVSDLIDVTRRLA